MIYFLLYPVLFTLFRLLARLLGRLQTSGEANVPKAGAVLYCPNHLSDADPAVLLVCLPRRAWFVGKSELFELPVFGWLFSHLQGFPIKRDSADRAALRRAENLLRRGEPLVIFPEGRCAQDGRLQRLQAGAALLSLRTETPIVPVGIRHTNEILPYGAAAPRFSIHPVRVDFGPPLRPQEFFHLGHAAAIKAITRRLSEALGELTEQTAPEI